MRLKEFLKKTNLTRMQMLWLEKNKVLKFKRNPLNNWRIVTEKDLKTFEEYKLTRKKQLYENASRKR